MCGCGTTVHHVSHSLTSFALGGALVVALVCSPLQVLLATKATVFPTIIPRSKLWCVLSTRWFSLVPSPLGLVEPILLREVSFGHVGVDSFTSRLVQ